MTRVSDLENQVRALAAKGLAAVDDNRPWSAKSDEVKAIDAATKTAIAQLAEAKGVDANRAGLGFDPRILGEANPDLSAFGPSYGRIAPPSLTLSDESMKSLIDAASRRQSVSVKATATTDAPQSLFPQQIVPPISFAREPTRILSVIPNVATSAGVVEYYTTVGTASAAPVAEGAVKPTSTLSYTRKTATMGKIATVIPVNDEVLMDFPAAAMQISADLVAGVVNVENQQLLSGSGTPPAQLGLLNVSGILTRVKGSETSVETLELASTDLRVGSSFVEPDAVILHPTTWSILRRTKDSQGRYLVGDPTGPETMKIWDIPVIETTAMPVATALLGNFQQSTLAYVRSGIRVDSSGWGTTEFTQNQTMFRCEERLAVVCTRSTGLIKVTGLV